MPGGRIEARVTTPAGGWAITVDGNGKTLSAGDRYPSALLTDLQTLLLQAPALTGATVTASFGEAGTGKVTIAASATFTLLWVSTDLRDLLGFTADLSGSASYTSERGMEGVWIPACAAAGDTYDPQTDGHPRTDETSVVGPTGQVATWVSSSYKAHRNIRWSHVSRARAIDGADASLVSWQQWVRQSQRAGRSYFIVDAAGRRPPVKIYRDADSDALAGAAGSDGVYRLVLPAALDLARPSLGYTGLCTVEVIEAAKVT